MLACLLMPEINEEYIRGRDFEGSNPQSEELELLSRLFRDNRNIFHLATDRADTVMHSRMRSKLFWRSLVRLVANHVFGIVDRYIRIFNVR